ncbi:MAG: amidohydrolase family protein, partial [Theionarchaea archaeon]|nr:amidohydrolase family protein [Theionarchaea archaeon]
MQLSTFDANCRLNRHLKLRSGEPHTAEDLLGEMDHFGISESLVVDSLSRENHPDDGNHRIIETTRGHPRLHPAWSVVPTGPPDEQPEPEELVRSMRENKVGAIFLYPRQYRFGLLDWEVDAFLKPLSEVGVPVFVDYGEIGGIEPPWDETDWGEVVGLCRRLPDLELIVGEKRFRRSNRTIYRALDACESLHIEISGYWLHKGIEYITRNWGSGRLVFGSNWPRWGQGCTLASLMCADIDREDKERIAGGNLRELLSWCGLVHPEVALPPPADEYIAMGSGMKPPGEMRFMDCHG